MAYVYVPAIHKFVGNSTDTLPSGDHVVQGMGLYQADTRNEYMYDGTAFKPSAMPVQLYGSKVCLSSEAKPAGEQGDTLLEYDEITGETKVYKYISGDWREL